MVVASAYSIRLILKCLLTAGLLLAVAAKAMAWTGYPGAYPGNPYGPVARYRPPVMPGYPAAVVYGYPVYPGYAVRRGATAGRPASAPAVPARAVAGSRTAIPGKLPAALADADLSSDQRKRLFIEALLPVVVKENERLLGVRRELVELQSGLARGRTPGAARRAWLRELAADYRIDADADTGALIEDLLRRVDAIPAGLAIAQAANESAWGHSRFAREGNNLFGIWTYDEDKGIRPQRRAPGKSHFVRSYDSIRESVRNYMHNLNSHPAYQPLRERRAVLRERNQPLSALQLAAGLAAYSEQGDDYIVLIQSMIRANKLEHIAKLQLADATAQD